MNCFCEYCIFGENGISDGLTRTASSGQVKQMVPAEKKQEKNFIALKKFSLACSKIICSRNDKWKLFDFFTSGWKFSFKD